MKDSSSADSAFGNFGLLAMLSLIRFACLLGLAVIVCGQRTKDVAAASQRATQPDDGQSCTEIAKASDQCRPSPRIIPLSKVTLANSGCGRYPTLWNPRLCPPPGPPIHLRSKRLAYNKTYVEFVVDWLRPEKSCTLTGYQLTIYLDGSRRCLCFNVSADQPTVTLTNRRSSHGDISQCLKFNKDGYEKRIKISVTSLPIGLGKYRETIVQEAETIITIPSCRSLTSRPNFCRDLPPLNPEFNVSLLDNISALVQWQTPQSEPQVEITYYELIWGETHKVYRHNEVFEPLSAVHLEPNRTRYVTPELDLNVSYTFVLRAASTAKNTPRPHGFSADSHQTLSLLSVNGNWTNWSSWRGCSGSCDKSAWRFRNCTNPEPAFGGYQCEGSSREERHCRLLPTCFIETKSIQRPTLPTNSSKPGSFTSEFYRNAAYVTVVLGSLTVITFVILVRTLTRMHRGQKEKMAAIPVYPINNPTDRKSTLSSASTGSESLSTDSDLPRQYSQQKPQTDEGKFHCPVLGDMPSHCQSSQKPTVYISYSRTPSNHLDNVLAFSAWLSRQGVTVLIDKWNENELAADIAGWIQRTLLQADFVISICTPLYSKAWLKLSEEELKQFTQFDANDDKDGMKCALSEPLLRRAFLETMLIQTEIMAKRCRNTCCIPVLLSRSGCDYAACVPATLRNSRVYHISDYTAEEAKDLLFRLYRVEPYQRPSMQVESLIQTNPSTQTKSLIQTEQENQPL